MASELLPCPFCSKTMMLRSALWPSEGDADAIIHADPTDCPMLGFSDGSADGSIIEKWNCSLSNEDDFPSDGSCVRCGSVPRNANGLCNTCLDEDAERLENTRPSPVAPVSPDATGKCGELVTVGIQYAHEHSMTGRAMWGWQKEWKGCAAIGTRELVARSQAEELLAAEIRRERDLAEKQLSEVVDRMSDDYLALKAELDQAVGVIEDRSSEYEALEAKLTAAEKALRTYRSAVKSVCESQRGTKWGKAAECIFDAIERAVLGGNPS